MQVCVCVGGGGQENKATTDPLWAERQTYMTANIIDSSFFP